MSDSSTKPYLIRAIHEWCTDQGYTPYLAVSVNAYTVVPREYVRNGEIVLNVGHLATNRLKLGNDLIEFQARFNGAPRDVSVPVEQVTAIYARETGHGMAFEVSKPPAEPVVQIPGPPALAPVRTAGPVKEVALSAAPAPEGAPPVPPDKPGGNGAGANTGSGGKNGGGKPRPALKRIK
jgi:stringent starvation protein B